MNQSQKLYHVIRPKDTIFWLAKMYDTTVEDIIKNNPGINQHNLQVGSRIVIYPGREGMSHPTAMPTMPNQSMPNQSMPDQAMPNQSMPGQSIPNQSMPGQPMTGQPMPNQSMSNRPMPNQPMLDQSLPGQTTPNQSRPNQTTPNQPRPNQTAPNQSRPNQATPNQSRPNQTTPNQPRPNQTMPNQSRPNQSQPNQSRPNQTAPNQSRPNQATPNQSRPNQTMPNQSQPNQSRPNQAMPNQSMGGWPMPNQSMSGRPMSDWFPSGQMTPGQSMSSQIMSNPAISRQPVPDPMFNQPTSYWPSMNQTDSGWPMNNYEYDFYNQADYCGSQECDYYGTYSEFPFIEYIPPETDGYGPPETNPLRDDMRRAWSDHVWWTRMLLISIAENLDDLSAVRTKLMQSPQEIADIFLPYFSEESADGIANLLTEHLQIGADMIVALRDNNLDVAQDLNRQWHTNAASIADALTTMNPNYDRQELQNMLEQHLNTTAKEVDARLAKDYTADIAAFDLVRRGAEEMADYLANGIVQ